MLHGINLRIEKGQIYGLIGPNGSGKTTLLKCMSGTYRPQTGQVTYEGEGIYDMPKVKQKAAYVSDALGVPTGYSLKHIAKDMDYLYDSFSMERFFRLAMELGLDTRKRLDALSKGQYTRFALALAFAQNPEYLLLDEPETGLDHDGKNFFRELLTKEVEERGIAVLVCSHDLADIERLCDRAAFIKDGEIIMDTPLGELFERVQKWSAVAEDSEAVKRQDNISLVVDHWMGKNVTFYTMGDRGQNEVRLASMGICELSGEWVTLEEAYALIMHHGNLRKEAGL